MIFEIGDIHQLCFTQSLIGVDVVAGDRDPTLGTAFHVALRSNDTTVRVQNLHGRIAFDLVTFA